MLRSLNTSLCIRKSLMLFMGQTRSRPLTNPSLTYATISRDKLTELVCNLNSRCQISFNESHVNMLFAIIEPEDPKTTLNKIFFRWKITVRIICFSIIYNTSYSKTYSLYDFLRFYESLVQILDASDASTTTNDSTTTEQLMKMSIFQQECCSVDGLCIICMENRPNAVLPCAHAYCDHCVQVFLNMNNQRRCPLCRYQFDTNTSADDAWVMTETPARHNINEYLVKSSDNVETTSTNHKV